MSFPKGDNAKDANLKCCNPNAFEPAEAKSSDLGKSSCPAAAHSAAAASAVFDESDKSAAAAAGSGQCLWAVDSVFLSADKNNSP